MTSVLIVDDAPLFQAGLAAALGAEGFDIVGRVGDGEAALTAAAEFRPDVVLLDVLMPGLPGVDIISFLRDLSPGSRIILLTGSESDEDLLTGIRRGIDGYLTKTTPMPDLVSAIRAVVDGGAVISPEMTAKLFGVTQQLLRRRDVISARPPTLTGRELEVIQGVADGLTSKKIGNRLSISENTVRAHVRSVLDKLGLHSRSEAVAYAISSDLIRVPN